jgi:hypothetical protein
MPGTIHIFILSKKAIAGHCECERDTISTDGFYDVGLAVQIVSE